MQENRKPKELRREEDYRDYEDREIRDGWPYSDTDGRASSAPQNRGYGDTEANFDEDPEPGFILDTADAAGREEVVDTTMPLPADRIDDDALEAAVADKLDQAEDVDADGIDIHVDEGRVTLQGSVDTVASARTIEALARSVPGVTEVRNELEPIGVDTRIPRDG